MSLARSNGLKTFLGPKRGVRYTGLRRLEGAGNSVSISVATDRGSFAHSMGSFPPSSLTLGVKSKSLAVPVGRFLSDHRQFRCCLGSVDGVNGNLSVLPLYF